MEIVLGENFSWCRKATNRQISETVNGIETEQLNKSLENRSKVAHARRYVSNVDGAKADPSKVSRLKKMSLATDVLEFGMVFSCFLD